MSVKNGSMIIGRFCLIVGLCVMLFGCGDRPSLRPLSADRPILAFGDSLTSGYGGEGISYPLVLERLTGIEVINAGIPGEISAKGLKRLPALLDRHLPQLMILCHGGNDIIRRLDRNAMQQNLEQMVRLARERDIEVIFLGVPEFSFFLDATDQHDAVAERYGLAYLDETLPDILGSGALKSDNIHPNADGYTRMAEDIHQLMLDAGAL